MRTSTRRRVRSWAAPLLVAPLIAAPLAARPVLHELLRRSVPADGARLDEAPRELRLDFSRPVELALTRVELIDPNGGPVELAEPRLAADSANVVVVGVSGPLVAGDYTVRWRVVGPDGHPVEGRFGFGIAPGAVGLARAEPADTAGSVAPAPPGGAESAPPPAQAERSFGVGSPAYVAIRWFTFLCLVGLIGTVAFRLVVLPLALRGGGEAAVALAAPAAARARAIGMAVAAMLLAAALLRLLAQVSVLGAVEPAVVRDLLGATTWGAGWSLQVGATVAAALGLRWARRDPRAGWGLTAVAAVALAFTPGLSGHAAAAGDSAPLAVVADALHVLGAGGWLGSLALVLAAGIPAALRLEERQRGPAAAALVHGFSPSALAFAGAVVATGVYASSLHLGGVGALWNTTYGRTLLVKIAALSLVFATGAYNFLRVRPALGDAAGVARIRRSSLVELAVGVIVLVVTSVLVATPPAAEAPAAVRGADTPVTARAPLP